MAIIWRISLDRHVKNCENVALEIYEKVKQSAHLHFAVVYSEQGNMLTNRVQHMFLAGSMFVRKPQKVQTITGRANAEGVQRREVQSFFHPEFSAYVYLVKTEDMCPRDRRYISYSSTSYRLSLTSSLLLCAWSAPRKMFFWRGGVDKCQGTGRRGYLRREGLILCHYSELESGIYLNSELDIASFQSRLLGPNSKECKLLHCRLER